MNLMNFECFESGNADVDEWAVLKQAWLGDGGAGQAELGDGLLGVNFGV